MAESCGQEQTRWKTTVIMSTALQDHDISTVLQRQQHRVRYSESVETGSVIFPLSGIAFMLSDTQDFLRTGEEEFSKRIQKFINIHRNSFLVLSAALHGPEEWSVMFRIQRRNKQDKRQWTETDAQEVPPEHEEEVLYSEGDSTATDCPEGVESLSLEIFQNHLDAILCSVLWDDPAKTGRFLGSNLRVIPVHNPAETVKLMLTMAKVTSKPQADDTRCKIDMTKAQIIEKSPVWKMLQEYQWHCN